MTAGAMNLVERIRSTRRRRPMPLSQKVARGAMFTLMVAVALTYPWVLLLWGLVTTLSETSERRF